MCSIKRRCAAITALQTLFARYLGENVTQATRNPSRLWMRWRCDGGWPVNPGPFGIRDHNTPSVSKCQANQAQDVLKPPKSGEAQARRRIRLLAALPCCILRHECAGIVVRFIVGLIGRHGSIITVARRRYLDTSTPAVHPSGIMEEIRGHIDGRLKISEETGKSSPTAGFKRK